MKKRTITTKPLPSGSSGGSTPLPTDDSLPAVKARMDAVYNGEMPTMPGLAKMTKKQMAKALQSLWTVLDEMGIQRRNETSPTHHLNIYGRVLAACKNGPLVKE